MLRIIREIRTVPGGNRREDYIVHIYAFPDINTNYYLEYNLVKSMSRKYKKYFEENYNKILEFFEDGRRGDESLVLKFGEEETLAFLSNARRSLDTMRCLKVMLISNKNLGINIKNLLKRDNNIRILWGSLQHLKTNSALIKTDELYNPKLSKDDILDILSNPETTTDFGIYLEINLLKHYKLL